MFWGQVLIGLWLRYIGSRDVGFSVKASSTKKTPRTNGCMVGWIDPTCH